MPFKDPDQRRAYHRGYGRMRRTAGRQTQNQTGHQTQASNPSPSPLNAAMAEFRIRTANDVLQLLGEQVHAVRSSQEGTIAERARTIGFLMNVALRAIDAADIAGRVEAIEMALKNRKE